MLPFSDEGCNHSLQSVTVGADDCEDESDPEDLRGNVGVWSALEGPSSFRADREADCLHSTDGALVKIHLFFLLGFSGPI